VCLQVAAHHLPRGAMRVAVAAACHARRARASLVGRPGGEGRRAVGVLVQWFRVSRGYPAGAGAGKVASRASGPSAPVCWSETATAHDLPLDRSDHSYVREQQPGPDRSPSSGGRGTGPAARDRTVGGGLLVRAPNGPDCVCRGSVARPCAHGATAAADRAAWRMARGSDGRHVRPFSFLCGRRAAARDGDRSERRARWGS
jgi:hypothetical protein